VAVLNPDHLFQQAQALIATSAAGPPRQVDLRRAISAAYYGVFHFVLTEAADEFVGVTQRSTARYALVYRSINHRGLKDLCNEAKKTPLNARYQRYAPPGGFGPSIQAFAGALIELQEKRHSADYDPATRIKTSDASLAIATARSAIAQFNAATTAQRQAFLALVLFQPR
jgi:hypothetical protein